MNTSSEVADLMVKEAIQVTESAVKLAGLGAKNLAALLIAVMQDNQKTQGKTNIQKLIKEGKQLCILQIDKNDLSTFNGESKKYGVLYTAVADKTGDSNLVDIIAKHEDIGRLNYIMEKMGCPIPDKDDFIEEQHEQPKNAPARATKEDAPQKSKSKAHGNGSKKMPEAERTTKPSVKETLDKLKKQTIKKSKSAPVKGKSR
ncbi:MAG: PcfB family protein [Firmicutes bacterium]|jgi:Ulp1 family protease|nr:PcfB family protein [Bacillota bacterium]